MNRSAVKLIIAIGAALLACSQLRGGPTTQPQATGSVSRLAFRLVAASDTERGDPTIEMLHDPSTREMIPVRREVCLDEGAIARVGANVKEHTIYLEMTPEGSAKLQQVTGANIGRQLAIVLDGRILIAPRINSAVAKSVAITGRLERGDPETGRRDRRTGEACRRPGDGASHATVIERARPFRLSELFSEARDAQHQDDDATDD